MEKRIQRKVDELYKEKTKGTLSLKMFGCKEELRQVATKMIEKEVEQEMEQNLLVREKDTEERRIYQERMQKEFEKRQQEKEEEEEREQFRILKNKEDPDMPLTLKDLREIKGFDYDAYRRAHDELNVEILKRIAREKYPHKFNRPKI